MARERGRLRVVAFVFLVIVGTIIVFFGLGYVLGKLLLPA